MVKTVRVHLSDAAHQEWLVIKGDHTWYQVLGRGIEVTEHFSDKEWSQVLMGVTDNHE